MHCIYEVLLLVGLKLTDRLYFIFSYFTAKGMSGSGDMDSYLKPNATNDTVIVNTISLPARVFENVTDDKTETGVLFSLYADNTLFPIRINQTESENTTFKAIGSSVLSATVSGQNITDFTGLITITMSITALDTTIAQVNHQHWLTDFKPIIIKFYKYIPI